MTSNQRKPPHSPQSVTLALRLILTLVTVGGCSSKHALTPEQQTQADLAAYEQEIRKVVPYPARADQLVALTNEFQKLAQERIASIKNYRAKAAALNSNYDATREDYEALFSQEAAAREAFVTKAEALRERMVAFTSDSEWEALKNARLPALEADLQELL